MAAPRSTHMEAALRIVRYLKAHTGYDLFYRVHGHLRIKAFTNSDWVGSPSDLKSTRGCYTFLGGNIVTQKSKKRTVLAQSSAEAKYRDMDDTSCELM